MSLQALTKEMKLHERICFCYTIKAKSHFKECAVNQKVTKSLHILTPSIKPLLVKWLLLSQENIRKISPMKEMKCEFVPISVKCMFDTDNMYTCSYAGPTHQYHESRRRVFNDSKPSRSEQVLRSKLANKCKGFCKWISMHDVREYNFCQLYECRLKVLKTQCEYDH